MKALLLLCAAALCASTLSVAAADLPTVHITDITHDGFTVFWEPDPALSYVVSIYELSECCQWSFLDMVNVSWGTATGSVDLVHAESGKYVIAGLEESTTYRYDITSSNASANTVSGNVTTYNSTGLTHHDAEVADGHTDTSTSQYVEPQIWHGSEPALEPEHNARESLLTSLREQMLHMINTERTEAGLGNVTMANHTVAQAHAQEMFDNCYISHWNLAGLKPDMRYAMAGGQQYTAENVAGHDYCPSRWVYDSEDPETQLQEHMDGLMGSRGHRDNILDPYHMSVGIGIAWNDYSMWVVQLFEYDYVEFETLPHFTDRRALQFEGHVTNGTTLNSQSDLLVDMYYAPLPQNETASRLNNSYCYDNGNYTAQIRPKAPSGYYYTSDTVDIWLSKCPGPRDYTGPYDFRIDVTQFDWYEPEQVPAIDAAQWRAYDNWFKVTAYVGRVLESNGPGIYTIVIWADERLIASYPILWDFD